MDPDTNLRGQPCCHPTVRRRQRRCGWRVGKEDDKTRCLSIFVWRILSTLLGGWIGVAMVTAFFCKIKRFFDSSLGLPDRVSMYSQTELVGRHGLQVQWLQYPLTVTVLAWFENVPSYHWTPLFVLISLLHSYSWGSNSGYAASHGNNNEKAHRHYAWRLKKAQQQGMWEVHLWPCLKDPKGHAAKVLTRGFGRVPAVTLTCSVGFRHEWITKHLGCTTLASGEVGLLEIGWIINGTFDVLFAFFCPHRFARTEEYVWTGKFRVQEAGRGASQAAPKNQT